MKAIVLCISAIFLFVFPVSGTVYNLTENLTIFTDYGEEIPLVLKGVDEAHKWFNISGKIPLFIVVVSPDPKESQFGYFDRMPSSNIGFIFISPKEKYKKFLLDVTDDIYIAMVSHEVAHAILFYHYNYTDLGGHEYLAFNVFFDVLKKRDKEVFYEVLKKYEDVETFEYDERINVIFYKGIGADLFSIKCFKHRLEDGGILLRNILNGDFMSDWVLGI